LSPRLRPRSPIGRTAAIAAALLVGAAGATPSPAAASPADAPAPSGSALRLPSAVRAAVPAPGAGALLEGTGIGLWPWSLPEPAAATATGVPGGPRVAAEDAERLEVFLRGVAHRRQEAVRTVFFAALERRAAAERAAAERAAERAEAERAAAQRSRSVSRASTRTSGGSGGGASDLAGLRQCESGGNYGAVSSSGQYRGAYQFSRSTWDSVASGSHPHLVGVDPAAASPADQDAMARTLHARSGSSPWPVCGRHL